MRIRIKNYDKYMKKNQVYYYNNFVPNEEYDVLSILDDGKKIFYLICGNGIALYIAKNDVLMIDDTIPENWINYEFEKNNTIEDKSGELKIYIKKYYGPAEFIKDSTFLADVVCNGIETLTILKKIYKLIWHT